LEKRGRRIKKEKFKKEILKNLDFEFERLYLINKIVEKNG